MRAALYPAAIAVAGALLGLGSAADPKVGNLAPDFNLRGSDGKMYRLSDYRGKQAVVLAWFAKAFTSG